MELTESLNLGWRDRDSRIAILLQEERYWKRIGRAHYTQVGMIDLVAGFRLVPIAIFYTRALIQLGKNSG